MANKYAEKFNRRMPVYRKYPDIFAKEICNFDCDEWQTEGLRDLASSPRVSIKSGQGVSPDISIRNSIAFISPAIASENARPIKATLFV